MIYIFCIVTALYLLGCLYGLVTEGFAGLIVSGAGGFFIYIIAIGILAAIDRSLNYHEVCVTKKVTKIGACDRYGSCSVGWNDGTYSNYINYPVEGQSRNVCHYEKNK